MTLVVYMLPSSECLPAIVGYNQKERLAFNIFNLIHLFLLYGV